MIDDPVQRRHERKEVNWISVIRLTDGSDVPCTIKDVSASGLKICVTEGVELPETFMIKVVGMQLVFRVKMAWRRKYFVGVTIEKIAKLAADSQHTQSDQNPRSAPSGDQHARLGTRRRFEANS